MLFSSSSLPSARPLHHSFLIFHRYGRLPGHGIFVTVFLVTTVPIFSHNGIGGGQRLSFQRYQRYRWSPTTTTKVVVKLAESEAKVSQLQRAMSKKTVYFEQRLKVKGGGGWGGVELPL
jgi:hypothetical protein